MKLEKYLGGRSYVNERGEQCNLLSPGDFVDLVGPGLRSSAEAVEQESRISGVSSSSDFNIGYSTAVGPKAETTKVPGDEVSELDLFMRGAN